ncbi:MAG: hypothetical protein DMF93_07575 [Acidobacteria bacterium]|nr:MAG: hypothetical protein DMF93_07575 [Acidobacteriota bacterium]
MSVAALFGLWIAIVVGCGAVYFILGFAAPASLATASGPIGAGVGGLLSAMYFSAVTATSVGYGDIVPAGVARIVAIAESMAGLVLFGCVVSKFVSRRQEQLIDDIHHIAFEERLGRVRTNLLLVRTELQATARLCEGQAIAPPEAMARVESAAMVFVGELHAVHDLLYRPQWTPDETMFEAILAGLTSVFREFIELLSCVRGQRGVPTPALEASVAAMARLSREKRSSRESPPPRRRTPRATRSSRRSRAALPRARGARRARASRRRRSSRRTGRRSADRSRCRAAASRRDRSPTAGRRRYPASGGASRCGR